MSVSFVAVIVTSKILYDDNEQMEISRNATTTLKTSATYTSIDSDGKSYTTRKVSSTVTTITTTKIVDFPIDINLVTYDELIQINGVGETTANNIIDFRSKVSKITNMDMLLEVSGIGEKRLELLKNYLYVSESDYQEIISTEITTKMTEFNTEQITSESVYDDSITTQFTSEFAMRPVNINTASAEEISKCLLIDAELAEKIVELRAEIHYFSNSLFNYLIHAFTLRNHVNCTILVVSKLRHADRTMEQTSAR